MLEISKLERRWLKYKIRRMLPYVSLALAVIALSIMVPIIMVYNSSTAPTSFVKELTKNTKTPSPDIVNSSEDSMILEPSMNFLQDITSSTQSANTTPTAVLPIITTQAQMAQPHTRPLSSAPITKSPAMPIQKDKLTSIKRDDATFNIHELEERFKNNSNPNLGLYIARYHYDHGNYVESYNYALKTNAINSSMEESWLIFAKSLVKLGKEDQARKTLQLYISNSNSQSAKNYLDMLTKESSK